LLNGEEMIALISQDQVLGFIRSVIDGQAFGWLDQLNVSHHSLVLSRVLEHNGLAFDARVQNNFAFDIEPVTIYFLQVRKCCDPTGQGPVHRTAVVTAVSIIS
jgi:hypothetical protein